MEYVKINSLWKREGWYFDQDKKKSPDYQKGRQSFIIGDYACPEFGAIKEWSVDEKIDGTNIRIYYTTIPVGDKIGPRVYFHGRTNDAQLPPKLLEYLQQTFTLEKLAAVFPAGGCIVLYGEGYGPKIQSCGGNYRKDQGFILFDVNIGTWWLKRLDVEEIAKELGVPMVPQIGFMNEAEIVEYVKSKPKSLCSLTEQVMEGVVCRSHPLMLFRSGNPIMWKLKCKEFS